MSAPLPLRARAAALTVAGLVGGFAVARRTGNRRLGGALFAAAGAAAARHWYKAGGWPVVAVSSVVYAGAMGGSHPLAKRIGAWPSVAAVSAGAVAASQAAMSAGRR